MADITKCEGYDCSKKESCYRYTVNEGVWQSSFLVKPYDEGKECTYFIEMKKTKEKACGSDTTETNT